MRFTSPVLRELEEYGFIKDVAKPAELDALLGKEKVTLYVGFDLTAKSLHVGNLMPMMLLRKFVKHGHNVILLLGGATTKIGDPTGKDETRRVLSEAEIEANRESIRRNFGQFFDLNSPQVRVMDNNDWFKDFKYIDFLREVGVHFTVNRMLAMDSVALRLEREQAMSFVEFNYSLIQGYDFAHMYKHFGCKLQVGGSDQWGNIVSGMELIGRMHKGEAFALTAPLITRSDGQKMGKSADGAVWLSPELLSAYDYYQYFRNIPDSDVGQMLRFYTELPIEEIARLSALKGKDVNEAKETLAFEAAKLCRGAVEAERAREAARSIFVQGVVADGEHEIAVPLGEALVKVLVSCGAAGSNSEAKKLISSGAVRLDSAVVESFSFTFGARGVFKLSVGKKKHYKLVVN